MKKIIIPALLALVMMNTACDSTEIENIKYYPPTVEEMNPAEYENYLADLRTFKTTDHKVMILTMEGTAKYPVTQAQLPMAMPDSADYICIKNSVELHDVVVSQIKEVKERKGTKVLSYVDFTIADEEWKAYSNGLIDEGKPLPTLDERKKFYKDNAVAQLASYDNYGFDGIMVSYIETDVVDEKIECQKSFMEAVKEWNASHPEHLMFMRGYLKLIRDSELLSKSKYYILVLNGKTGTYAYKSELRSQIKNLQDKDRNVFEIMVPAGPGEEQVGDSPLKAAETILSDEVANYEPYKTVGLCVSNAADDYFTADKSFANICPAINYLNQAQPAE